MFCTSFTISRIIPLYYQELLRTIITGLGLKGSTLLAEEGGYIILAEELYKAYSYKIKYLKYRSNNRKLGYTLDCAGVLNTGGRRRQTFLYQKGKKVYGAIRIRLYIILVLGILEQEKFLDL